MGESPVDSDKLGLDELKTLLVSVCPGNLTQRLLIVWTYPEKVEGLSLYVGHFGLECDR